MTFKPFRALCLEGASCCCLDLYAAMTYKLFQNKKKIVWGTCVKVFNSPCFRHKANKTVNISLQSCMLQRSKVSVVTAYRDVTVYRA